MWRIAALISGVIPDDEQKVFEDSAGCRSAIEAAGCDAPFYRVLPHRFGYLGISTNLPPPIWQGDDGSDGISLYHVESCRQAVFPSPKASLNEACLAFHTECEEGLYCRLSTEGKRVSHYLCGICEETAEIGEFCDTSVRWISHIAVVLFI
jgi:hypothetical protein